MRLRVLSFNTVTTKRTLIESCSTLDTN